MKTLLLSKLENRRNCGMVGDHTPTFVKTPESNGENSVLIGSPRLERFWDHK